jgi:prepilin-type N-terminal cleavage/methylation domain-containing protein
MFHRTRAFTLLELLVVVAMIAVILLLATPTHKGAKEKATGARCLNNLRQINLGGILWASAAAERFPWQTSTNAGGSLELIGNGIAADHFAPLAAMIPNPAVFLCPADRTRSAASQSASLSNSNLSYFVSLNATLIGISNPAALLLTGDRHLAIGKQPIPSGLFETNNSVGLDWLPGWHGPSSDVKAGMVGLVDGHAIKTESKNLAEVFQRSSITTHRLVMP